MSRIEAFENKQEYINEEGGKIIKNPPSFYDDSQRVLIIDGDSVIWMQCYKTEDDIEEAKFRIRTKLRDIQLVIEEYYNIAAVLIFIGGSDNFRSKVFSEYKANRPPKPQIIKDLFAWIPTEYTNCITSNFAEADDYVYSAWSISNRNCVVASFDKDLRSFIWGCPIFDYKKDEFLFITEEEAKYNFRCQLLMGDTSDNIKLNKGTGIKYCQKVLYLGMSELAFAKEMVKLYKKNYGLAYKEKIKFAYKLLSLHHINTIKEGL